MVVHAVIVVLTPIAVSSAKSSYRGGITSNETVTEAFKIIVCSLGSVCFGQCFLVWYHRHPTADVLSSLN